MADLIDGLHGKPNSTRIIVYENKYDEDGLLIGMTARSEIIMCKGCKHFHYDMPYVIQGIPVYGHEVCDFWGDGCKTSETGFCSYAERRANE